MNAAIQGILIDLDDTLMDDRQATRLAFAAFVSAHQVSLPTQSDSEALASWRDLMAFHWQRYELGQCGLLDQRRARVRAFLQRPLTDQQADLAFEPYRIAYESAWTLVPQAREFLERSRNVPKVIVTNGERSQQLRKVQACGLLPHVVGVVTPMDCGHWKPRPEIFLAGLTMLGLEASQCLMIGDDPVRDIEPATRLNIKTLLVDPLRVGAKLLDAFDIM